jgi:uncharacterized membrane protein SpoIIM required for sporulation
MAPILSNQWIAKRRPHWDRLAFLLTRSDQHGVGSLSRSELQEMALLYRQVAGDLSVLRRDETARTYTDQVNMLLARAHHIIYSRKKTSWATLYRFLKDEYPVIVRKQSSYVLASLLVSVAWGILGAALTSARPEFMRHYVGPAMISTMEQHKMWTESIVSVAPQETSHIMTNNLSVSFLTLAGGIIFGLGTFLLLFNNGMMLGVIAAACHQYGMSIALWSFVVPHGSLELPAIIIAGGAGFRIGRAMLFPEGYRWKESVARGGIEASQLVSGVIPMLVIAGCLEGFFSPSHAPVWLKFTVGGLLFASLLTWLFRPVKVSTPVQI